LGFVAIWLAPPRDTALGSPGHDFVDPKLGQQLDGTLSAITFRERLHHHDTRTRHCVLSRFPDFQNKPIAQYGSYGCRRVPAMTISEQQLLANSKAPNPRGMVTFRTVQNPSTSRRYGVCVEHWLTSGHWF